MGNGKAPGVLGRGNQPGKCFTKWTGVDEAQAREAFALAAAKLPLDQQKRNACRCRRSYSN